MISRALLSQFQGLTSLGGARLLVSGLSFATSIIIARHLGAEQLGEFALIVAVFSYLSIFSEFGLQSAVTAEASRALNIKNILRPYLKIRLGICFFVYFVSIVFSYLLFREKLISISLVLSSMFFLAFRLDWVFLVNKDYKRAAFLSSIRWVVYFFLVAVFSDFSITGLSLIFAFSWASSAMVSCFLTFRSVLVQEKSSKQAVSTRKLILVGFPILGATLASQLLQNADLIWVGYKFGSENAGYYYLAGSIISAGLIFANAMGQIANAKYASIEGDLIEFSNALQRDIVVVVVISIAISAVYLVLGGFAMALVFGKEYFQSYNLLKHMIPYFILYHVWSLLFYVLIAVGKERSLFLAKLISIFLIPVIFMISAYSESIEDLASLKAFILIPSILLMMREFSDVCFKSVRLIIWGVMMASTLLSLLMYV